MRFPFGLLQEMAVVIRDEDRARRRAEQRRRARKR